MNFFTQIKDLLRISRTETNGYFLLLLLSLAIVVSPLILMYFAEKGPVFSAEDKAFIDSLTSISDALNDEDTGVEKFMFDPNTASIQQLKELSIPHSIAARIVNYREKGGQFRQKEDLAKIYGLDSTLFTVLFDYIEISPVQSEVMYPLDINKVSSSQFAQFSDVSDRVSIRIINYGRKLGGYVHMDQLDEVYGLDSSVIVSLKNKLYISRGFTPIKININQVGYETLADHPYISDELARSIIRYRELNGDIRGAEELKHFTSVDRHQIDKLFPYLEF